MESFESNGEFWFPRDRTKKYAGILKFNPIDGGCLEIFKDLEAKRYVSNEKHDIVLALINRTAFTLVDCRQNGFYSASVSTIFDVEYIIKGMHFDSLDAFKIKAIQFDIKYLNSWININMFNLEKADNINIYPEINYNANINDSTKLTMCVYTNDNYDDDKLILEKKAYFSLIFSTEKKYKEIEWIIYHLRDFIGLTTSQPVYINDVIIPDNYSVVYFKKRSNNQDLNERVNYYDMLYNFKDIEEIGFEKAILNWFDDYGKLKHIFRMFLLPHYYKQILEFEFLNLAQTLDSYLGIYCKKHKHKTEIIPEKEFKRRTQILITNLPDNEDKEVYKTWLNGINKHIGFTEKLFLLFTDYELVFKEMQNKEIFVKSIIKTRNALSHGLSDEAKEKEKLCCTDIDLSWLYHGVKMILSAVFLRKIGFDDQKVSNLLKRNCIFKSILENDHLFKSV